MDKLSFTLLGGNNVLINDRPVTSVTLRKAQALLFYLVVTGRAHSRSALAGLLWGDLPEASARGNLRKALSQLRAVSAHHLLVTRDAVGFDPEAPVYLDVAELEAAGRAVAGHRSGDELDVVQLSAVVELYRGDFLSGFDVGNAPDFENWLRAQRVRLRDAVVHLLTLLLDYHAHRPSYEEAIAYGKRLVTVEPWREQVHRRLMQLLAISGRRAEALAQFEACRDALAETLDAEPSAETVALVTAIRAGELAPKTPDLAPAPDSPTPRPARQSHNLPPSQIALIGRESELAALDVLIANRNVRLVTIVGAGGMGKTRLALAAAERQLNQAGNPSRFTHGVYFVPLASLEHSRHIVPAIADAVGFRLRAGAQERRAGREQLLDYLREKAILLVLDNMEHLLPDTALVQAMQREAPEVRLLVTSREQLHVEGEHVYPIYGLQFPARDEVASTAVPDPALGRKAAPPEAEAASEYAAINLFLHSARTVRPDFSMNAAERAAVLEICRIVDGMPLGIKLAAGWVNSLSVADILAEIRRSFDFLTTRTRDVPARHRSLRAAIDVSWQLLDKGERRVFSTLSVFHGGLTRRAASRVADASLWQLANLVDKSLLHYDRERDRYEMHSTLRQYGAEQLATRADEESAVFDAHCEYFTATLHGHEEALKGAGRLAALTSLAADIDNIRGAWQRAVTHRQLPSIARGMRALFDFYHWRGLYPEGRAACEEAIAALGDLDTVGDADACYALARLQAWRGFFEFSLGKIALAQTLLAESLANLAAPALAERDTRRAEAFVYLMMGRVTATSDLDLAARHLAEALALYQALAYRWGEATALHALGENAWQAGRLATAMDFFDESRQGYLEIDFEPGLAATLAGAGKVAYLQGRLAESQRLIGEGLATYRRLNDRPGMASALGRLSEASMMSGLFADGRDQIEECVAILRDLGDRSELVQWTTGVWATININLGQYGRVSAQLRKDLAYLRQSDNRVSLGRGLRMQGTTQLADRRYRQAYDSLEESIAVMRSVGDLDGVARAMGFQAYAARGLGAYEEAQQTSFSALELAVVNHFFNPLIVTLPGVALLMAELGDIDEGVALYRRVSAQPLLYRSRFFAETVGIPLEQMADGRDVRSPAVARQGQEGALWDVSRELLTTLPQKGWNVRAGVKV